MNFIKYNVTSTNKNSVKCHINKKIVTTSNHYCKVLRILVYSTMQKRQLSAEYEKFNLKFGLNVGPAK